MGARAIGGGRHWVTEIPNLRAQAAVALEVEKPQSKPIESESKLSLPPRSWAADARTSPSVTHNNAAPPSPPLHDDPGLTFHPPKEPVPQGPVKGHYLGNPDWPTTDGVLDSDRQGDESGFGSGRVPGFGRR
jgi:hypothetical protein